MSRSPSQLAQLKASMPSTGADPPEKPMMSLVLELVRPYRGWLAIVFTAMMFEIAMSLAAPWPLKLVLDDALGTHKLRTLFNPLQRA